VARPGHPPGSGGQLHRVRFAVRDLDEPRYIALLREYDMHRDSGKLAAFIAVQSFNE
jgi:hypothetical protein